MNSGFVFQDCAGDCTWFCRDCGRHYGEHNDVGDAYMTHASECPHHTTENSHGPVVLCEPRT